MEIVKGDIVISLAGRDKDRYFYVLETDGEFVLLADGRLRKADKPKRKKKKHVRFAGRPPIKAAEKIRSGERVHSSELRKGMTEFTETATDRGGI